MQSIKHGRVLRLATLNSENVTFYPEGFKQRRKNPDASFLGRVRSWLANKMWQRLLKWKMLEPYHFTETIYSYGEAEAQEVSKLIQEDIWRLFDERGINRPEDYCIVLGGQEFYDISKGYITSGHDILTVPSAEFRYSHCGGYRSRVMSFPCYVVPWLTGAAVLPKVIVERLPKEHERPL